MTLSLVRPSTVTDPGDRVTSDGVWSLTHELDDDDDTGASRVVVVATHLTTGLQLTHDQADVDDWLMSGLALAELKVQAVSTFNGLALAEDKAEARAALVTLGLLLPARSAEMVEYRCECGGYLALAPGRVLVHVDVCRQDIDPVRPSDPDKRGRSHLSVVCDPADHRICLEPAARICSHGCGARACAYAPPCTRDGHEDHCGVCCEGRD